MSNKNVRYIGLIPAAGYATRLQDLPCSKEIYPVRVRNEHGNEHEIPVCKYLIDAYQAAGIKTIYMILREGKEDICDRLGNGSQFKVNITYLYTQKSYGPPYTLDEAYPNIQGSYLALGFPDILFQPRKAFMQLMEKQQRTKADVVLGLFRAPNPNKMDMVEFDTNGNIQAIHIKPQNTSLLWTWILTVWNPSFSEFMHHVLEDMLSEFQEEQHTECHVGTIFQKALREGITFDYVFFNDGQLIDIGTPEDLRYIETTHPVWVE